MSLCLYPAGPHACCVFEDGAVLTYNTVISIRNSSVNKYKLLNFVYILVFLSVCLCTTCSVCLCYIVNSFARFVLLTLYTLHMYYNTTGVGINIHNRYLRCYHLLGHAGTHAAIILVCIHNLVGHINNIE